MALIIHIVAGGAGLISGFIALYATKGATVHRRAGMVFVWAMLTMCFVATALAAVRNVAPAVNIPAALITAYLVITALTTVRRPTAGSRRLDFVVMLLALATGLVSLSFGFEALAEGGKREGMPAFPFFLFGIVGVLAPIGDLRVILSGALQGSSRLARHLWRMTFALFIAALSFFIGQAKVIPEPLRVPGLLALPVLAVLVTLLYWLWRVRMRTMLRTTLPVSSREQSMTT